MSRLKGYVRDPTILASRKRSWPTNPDGQRRAPCHHRHHVCFLGLTHVAQRKRKDCDETIPHGRNSVPLKFAVASSTTVEERPPVHSARAMVGEPVDGPVSTSNRARENWLFIAARTSTLLCSRLWYSGSRQRAGRGSCAAVERGRAPR